MVYIQPLNTKDRKGDVQGVVGGGVVVVFVTTSVFFGLDALRCAV
jgi:hypothetical protein